MADINTASSLRGDAVIAKPTFEQLAASMSDASANTLKLCEEMLAQNVAQRDRLNEIITAQQEALASMQEVSGYAKAAAQVFQRSVPSTLGRIGR